MKKILIGILLLMAIGVAGYVALPFITKSSIYKMTLQSQLSAADFDMPKGQMSQVRETYQVEGLGYFTANVLHYGSATAAASAIEKLKKEHNPSMIVLATRYVNYYPDPASNNTYHHHFYQSGQNVIATDHTGTKDDADAFVSWYYAKYPNQ